MSKNRDRTPNDFSGIENEQRPEPTAFARPISSADIEGLESVVVREDEADAAGDATCPVFIHESVVDWLGDQRTNKDLKKNLTRRVHELMAAGRASRAKGVKGTNRGYVRIPLGGTKGKQYYLWLLNRGESVKRQATREFYGAFPDHARLLRAVCHHDDTGKMGLLEIGRPEDYIALDAANVIRRPEAETLVDPLTELQRRIVSSGATTRFIQGQPGAGKTTSLHESVRRFSGRLLYLTWSRGLAEQARDWLRLSAPPDVKPTIWTFQTFLQRLNPSGSTSSTRPLSQRIAELSAALSQYSGQLSAWSHGGQLRGAELYAEIHAHLLGTALPFDFRGRSAAVGGRLLSEADYCELREKTLGRGAAQQAHMAARKLLKANLSATLFPELHDAYDRAFGLAEGRITLDPEVFEFDWVLVDEIQDLTTLEQWLVVDVCARAGAARNIRPGLVVAGDEAQTVRPTAFEWGGLDNLVRERFGADVQIEKHELKTNLRAPHDLALFVDNIRRDLYGKITKNQRPRGGQEFTHTEATVSRLLQLEVGSDDAREQLLSSFASQSDAAIITTRDIVPPVWAAAAKAHGTVVWTSEEAKGLEFRIVAVIDVPEAIAEIQRLADDAEQSRVCGELARAAIDRLLVAVSRSSEVLLLLSSDWSGAAQRHIDALVGEDADGNLGQVSLESVADLLELDADEARDQIDRLLSQSERLQDAGDLDRALLLARNAHGLLGRSGRPGAAGGDQRSKVRRRLGVLLAEQSLQGQDLEQLRKAQQKLRSAKRGQAASALLGLLQIGEKDDHRGLAVQQAVASTAGKINALQDEEPTLVRPVIEHLAAYLEKLGACPSTRMGRRTLVEALGQLADTAPLGRERFKRARERLILAMLEELADATTPALIQEFAEIRGELEGIPELRRLDARHAEAKGEHEDAAHQWRSLGDRAGAMRCIRRTSDLRAAEAMARSFGQHKDLGAIGWAIEVLEALERPPPSAIHESDMESLRAAIERLLARAKIRREDSTP